ncbi:protein FAM241B [Pantherophis guttatus]|uniref:Protein FAM241B n=1 Tax=Pantherophis guttatus TaxID=94885 RepID=A0A6P9DQ79_PANGU|nr:protein FAM241B [Pantherophis guttatus]XP_060538225.1 protein FAM241B [Pantherophis guttatus]
MVRILANGDIVQDDDPRVRQTTQNRENSSRLVRNGGFFNATSNAGPNPPQHYQQQQQQQQRQNARPGERSPFSDINQQLVNMGFPTWHLGNQVVEPVMSILLLFLLMMVGVRGLLLVGLIYVVSHLSQR